MRLGGQFPHLNDVGWLYCGASVLACVLIWEMSGLRRRVYAFATWDDLATIVAIAVAAPIFGAFIAFGFNRLDGIPRSLPIYQGLVILFSLGGLRLGIRLIERGSRIGVGIQNRERIDAVLVGSLDLAAVFGQAIISEGADHINIAGILTDDKAPAGMTVSGLAILGTVGQFQNVISELRVHGVMVTRLILLLPDAQLDPDTRSRMVSDGFEVHNFYETLRS